jgi:predicted flap endonuclease-1-like 5' DNA nuclease
MAQEGKALAATSALIVGLMLGTNYMVSENKDNNWLIWAFLFLGLAVVLWVWMYRSTKAVERAADAERANEAAKAMKEAEDQIARLTAKAEDKLSQKAAPPAPEPIKEVDVAPEEPEPTIPEPASQVPEMPDDTGTEPEATTEQIPETEPEPKAEPVVEPEPVAAASDEEDDLTRVEGIGPKYRDALIEAGITTFAQIAAMTEEQLVDLIRDAGMRKPPSVGTWAEQAKLAAADDWEGLDALQERLSGGRR